MRHGVAATWAWLESHPRRALLLTLTFAACLRLPFVGAPFGDDEGGFLMVASQWHERGVALYTNQWVDRPPVLLLAFRLAYLLGGSFVVVRVIALVLGSLMIVAAWYAGAAINGARGAVASAVVVASLSASFAMSGVILTSECVAGAFVMVSCALVLQAMYGGRPRHEAILMAFAAGVCASLAFLSKQNFIDAGVFAAVLLCIESYRAWRLLVSGLVGLVVPLVATVIWANSQDGPGMSRFWVAIFQFRKHSLRVIEHGNLDPPLLRLRYLVVLFFATGIFFLMCQLLLAVRGSQSGYALRIALVVLLLYDFLSVLAGASYWSHYLLQFSPVLGMGAALATRRKHRWLGGHAAPSYAVVASLVAASVGLVLTASGHTSSAKDKVVADFLHESSDPGDSIMTAYGSANVIQMSGLSTPYRYSWSLPIRARDPDLTEFVRILDGDHPPTWLVEMGKFDWWGLDNPQFQQARARRYHLVANVCGHDIYLLDGLARRMPKAPAC
jgi:4-amino-4-deoxy-L-arabinose transferase-like glycosyltransferase